MTPSLILVYDINESELQSCLADFANIYAPYEGLANLDIYRRKGATDYLVVVPDNCDFTHFAYCVNYIVYSRKPGLPRPSADGYYAVAYDPSLPFLTGDVVRVYVATDDKEVDNVTVVNDRHETYLFPFGDKPSLRDRGERLFQPVPVSLDDYHFLITMIPTPDQEQEQKPWWKFW